MRTFAQPRVIEGSNGNTMLLYRIRVAPDQRHKGIPIPPGCYVVVLLEGPEYRARSLMGPQSEHMALRAVQTLRPEDVVDMLCDAMENARKSKAGVPEGTYLH